MIARKRITFLSIALMMGLISFSIPDSYALWTWTPETGWVNPRRAVKPSPEKQFAWAEELFQKGEHDQALTEHRKLIRSYPESIYAPRSQYAIGVFYEVQGKYSRAVEEFQKVIDNYPASDKIVEVAESQYRLGNLFFAKKTESKLKRVFRESNYAKAARAFGLAIKNAPHSERAAGVQYKIGLSYRKQGNFPEAISEYRKVIENYPQSPWVENAYYGIALSYLSQSLSPLHDQIMIAAALKQFQDLRERFPNSELTSEVEEKIKLLRERKAERIYRIAQFYEKGGHIQAASIYYQEVVERYPQSNWAASSRERLGELQKKTK